MTAGEAVSVVVEGLPEEASAAVETTRAAGVDAAGLPVAEGAAIAAVVPAGFSPAWIETETASSTLTNSKGPRSS